jgi:hypothetical protein
VGGKGEMGVFDDERERAVSDSGILDEEKKFGDSPRLGDCALA